MDPTRDANDQFNWLGGIHSGYSEWSYCPAQYTYNFATTPGKGSTDCSSQPGGTSTDANVYPPPVVKRPFINNECESSCNDSENQCDSDYTYHVKIINPKKEVNLLYVCGMVYLEHFSHHQH